MTILFVCQKSEQFQSLKDALLGQVQLQEVYSAGEALEKAKQEKIEALVCSQTLPEMEGLELLKQLVKVNPLINTALVSDLPEKEFHEVTEGLGVLMQIPSDAGAEHGQQLLDKLAKVASLF
ncbi:response regulator transcription factor [Desulfogranum japonicum]|uniref:response regulator transcription factor n=1 Tax=Desulfogranum japonicum TaxID=231447 RepID=UPI000425C4E7|nr:response regulator [Desulfogranum japonicum]